MNKSNLHLVVTGHWFNMHARGGKDIEYRAQTEHWRRRLFDHQGEPKEFETVTFQLGYASNAPRITKEFKGISIGYPLRKWALSESWDTLYYNIHCGKILSLYE